MKKEIFDRLKSMYADSDTTTKLKVKKDIFSDYDYLIDLRNRLADCSDEIYEEDHVILDHILDYMEIFIDEIMKEKEYKNE